MNKLYYIQDSRSFIGNSPVWWGYNGSGYTSNLLKAGTYTEEESIAQHKDRITDIPWPKDYIDKHVHVEVDCQHINLKTALKGTPIKIKKPKKKRPTTGKHRHNCITCGKIIWDYDPYSEVYCNMFCKP